jgi:hypothetical protein
MKQMLRRYLSIVALFSAACFSGRLESRVFKIAPQADLLNFYTGIFEDINLPDMGNWYASATAKFEFLRSFKSDRITSKLFGNALQSFTTSSTTSSATNSLCGSSCSSSDCNNKALLIQGSRVASRNAYALLADYFGLPTDFSSYLTFCPLIEQFIAEINFWFSLDPMLCGAWAAIRLPFASVRTRLNARETIVAAGTNGYDAGYFTPGVITRANLLNSFAEYASGKTPTLGTGITWDPLNYGRFNVGSGTSANNTCCDNSDEITGTCARANKLADVQFWFGWNFWQDPDNNYHAGLGLMFVAPTGTRFNSTYLFAPQVGNGHHFEFGALWTSHYMLWRSCDWDRSFNFHFEAQVSHLFKSCEQHTFGLCNSNCTINDMSEYMLAMQLGANTTLPETFGSATAAATPFTTVNVTPTSPTQAAAIFNGHYSPLANLTTKNLDVSVKAQGYALLAFVYNSCNFSGEFGYQFYGRSGDSFDNATTGYFDSSSLPAWALKGDSFVYGFPISTVATGTVTTTTSQALSGTQSNACITNGLNFKGITDPTNTTLVETARRNPNIDNPQYAFVFDGTNYQVILSQPGTAVANTGVAPLPGQTRTSIQPVYLANSNVNIECNNQQRTHTLFGSLNYHWDYSDCWNPSLGIGGRVDFSGKNNCDSLATCSTSTSSCGAFNGCSDNNNGRRAGITQWGIWVKGAIAFN